jgi:hypothetical protein
MKRRLKMKRLSIAALVLVLSLPLVACGWNHPCTKTRSYNLGEEKIAVVGSEIVTNGCFATRWEPLGLTRDLWQRKAYNDESWKPLTDKELIYAGRENDVLHITYREYFQWRDHETGVVSSYARTPFFQQIIYDLKKSNVIVFQDWVIQVLDANNERIKFKVVNETPGHEIPPQAR